MKHLGDITKIDGTEVPIVDVITGGSPCQDLSIAGKRAGLAGERSGLFMEQIRIIKEMRQESERVLSIQKPNYDRRDIKPRYMVWENVNGAFSSNNGEDFRSVLEETSKVAERGATIPKSPEGKWSKSGCIMGNGWSIAWRLHDAQFWGVPQRRKRISLVADFGGASAPEILFERKGVSGDTEPCESKREETPRTVTESAGRTSGSTSYTLKIRGGSDTYIKSDGSIGTAGKGALIQKELSGTLGVSQDQTLFANCYSVDQGVGNSRRIVNEPILLESTQNHATVTQTGTCTTLTSSMGTGGGFIPMITQQEPISIGNGQLHDAMSPSIGVAKTLNCMDDPAKIITIALETSDCYGIDRASFNQGANAKFDFSIEEDKAQPIVAKGPGGVMEAQTSIVRRLTPLECERLQGYPDDWTNIGEWIDSNGKKHKDADTPRYKALGNSIALPFWDWMAERMCEQLRKDGELQPTMASLFDGIGGFPFVYQKHGCKPVWASEIEEFPIAVTKIRFPEESEDRK